MTHYVPKCQTSPLITTRKASLRSLLVVETFRSISLPTAHCTNDELDQAFPNFSMQRPQLHELIVLNTHVRGPQSKAENAFGPLVATLLCSRVVSVGQELCFCQLGWLHIRSFPFKKCVPMEEDRSPHFENHWTRLLQKYSERKLLILVLSFWFLKC